jgi:RNA polymerase sigma-70 factor (ECF subfamily)
VRLAGRIAAAGEVIAPDHAEDVAEMARLQVALARLDEIDRETLLLVAWEGLDHGGAAYAAGCSAATFRVRLFRARRRLARLLREPPPEHVRPALATTVKEN